MFKRLSLKAKVLIGSCAPLLLVIVLGVYTITSIGALLESNKWVDHTHVVIEEAMVVLAAGVDMETGMRGYLLAGKEEFLDPYKKGYETFKNEIRELKNTVSDNPAQVQLLNETEENIRLWVENVTEPQISLRREVGNGKAMQDIAKLVGEAKGKQYFDKFRGQIDTFISREAVLMEKRQAVAAQEEDPAKLKEAMAWVEHTYKVIGEANSILAAAVDMETGMRGYLLAGKEEFLEPYHGGYNVFTKKVSALKNTVNDNPSQVQLLGEIESNINEWREKVTEPEIALRREIGQSKAMQDVAALVGEARGKAYFDKFREQIGTFTERERILMEQRQAEAHKLGSTTQTYILVGIVLTLLIAGLLSLFIANSIVRQFKKIFNGLKTFSVEELDTLGDRFLTVINSLKNGSDQVSSASEQVSSSSQQLATGSSQQAASLEEVSSTLEEMSSITERNSANANEANTLSESAESAAQNGKRAMTGMADVINRMSQTVGRIKTSSDETAKIIKTIDEIAFQTNILALNAAVEAARAGEAGSGFAVVAEEVRNLAQRSAQAARDTTSLIDESVKNAEDGVSASSEVSETLKRIMEENIDSIVEGITKVKDINSEVAAASSEQSTGINQVNGAVAQMNELTQSNAANSEESSAASEQLSAQAEELGRLVETLVEITQGASERAFRSTTVNHDPTAPQVSSDGHYHAHQERNGFALPEPVGSNH